ncbi:MAG TPA: FecR family protein [Hyphomicrobium sp.]|nr:FecR family protein [Hyphomicrobium sp.]
MAAAGADIGSAVTVVSIVTASLEKDERKLAVGDGVRAQELISVDNEGRSELELRDKTKLALGPGAKLLLDKFIYDPDLSGGAIVMNLVRGSFRFVTGIAAKPAYVIHVPTASITVRGTIFDVYVKPDNSAWLLLIEGAIEVCTSNGKCVVHDEPGKLIRILPDTVGVPVKWAGLPGKEDAVFDSAFPFVSHAPTFDPNPVFTRDQIVLGTFPEKPHPKDTDNGDKGNDSGKKDEPTKKSSKDDDDQPRSKTKHTEVERYHRPRHEASDSNAAKGLNIMLGIGGGLKFGGHHNGGYEGTHRR